MNGLLAFWGKDAGGDDIAHCAGWTGQAGVSSKQGV